MELQFGPWRQRHQPKSALIVVPNFDALFRFNNDVIVWVQGLCLPTVDLYDKASRHAEMSDQYGAVIESNQEVFCASIHPVDPPPLKPGRKVRRQRNSQIPPLHLHPNQTPSLKPVCEAPADSFHLR